MQEKQGGLAGRHVQRACCPFWSRGRRHMGEGGGGDERSRGQGRGKYSSALIHPSISSGLCMESFMCSQNFW